jgi:hypothetical protein
MKTYIEHSNTIQFNDVWIPKDIDNTHYSLFLQEQERGEAELVPYVITYTWDQIRVQRDILIAATDWTQLPDVNIVNKQAWTVYRQSLRDITTTFSDPNGVVWPTKPS